MVHLILIVLLQQLLKLGVEVSAYDPTVLSESAPILESINICTSVKDVVQTADLLVVLTEWPEFSLIDPTELMDLMVGRSIFDTRGVIDKELWTKSGFTVKILGRP